MNPTIIKKHYGIINTNINKIKNDSGDDEDNSKFGRKNNKISFIIYFNNYFL